MACMKPAYESEIILARFEEVCPDIRIDSMSLEEIEESVKIAFEIIGYKPRHFQKAVDKATARLNRRGELFRLCYHAWRLDE